MELVIRKFWDSSAPLVCEVGMRHEILLMTESGYRAIRIRSLNLQTLQLLMWLLELHLWCEG
jgi:hypothetical protein